MANMKTFLQLLEAMDPAGPYYRYVHNNGAGLMNNQALDYMKLSDEEEAEVVDGYTGLQQPTSARVPAGAIFAFTEEGRRKHARLLNLLKKASKYGVRVSRLPAAKYDVIWVSSDGQVALLPKG